MTKLKIPDGVYAAALTPLQADLSCDHQALAGHCKDLLARGCQGVVLFGTTGEGASFSVQERASILRAVLSQGVDAQRVIVGIICAAVSDAVELIHAAVECRCAGVLLAPSFYYKNVSEEGGLAFYREVIKGIEDSDIRILLYHIPQLTGVPITVPIVESLCREFPDHITGFKESEGNLELTKKLLVRFPGFQVFVGGETHVSQAVRLGASGAISGLANAYPELICSLYAHGLNTQAPDRNDEITKMHSVLQQFPLFPAIKSIVESAKGPQWHYMRPPLVPLTEMQRKSLISRLSL